MVSKVHEKPIKVQEASMKVLDLYSGCGAMSTGLCLGAQLSGQRLVNVSQNDNIYLLLLNQTIV